MISFTSIAKMTLAPPPIASYWQAFGMPMRCSGLGLIEEADQVVRNHVNLFMPLRLFGEHSEPRPPGKPPVTLLAECQQIIQHQLLWPLPGHDTERAPVLSPIPSRIRPSVRLQCGVAKRAQSVQSATKPRLRPHKFDHSARSRRYENLPERVAPFAYSGYE